MEFSDPECLEFFFNALWHETTTEDKKHLGIKFPRRRATILDTIVFREGKPFKWLFTSDKSGEVLRKTLAKMKTDEIVRSFTNRVRVMRGIKMPHVKEKIATVYYHGQKVPSNSIESRLINEIELRYILDGETNEDIMAIQVFVGGVHHIGNGVYEHIIERENDHIYHESYELLNSVTDDKWGCMSDIYTSEIEKLRVETVHHWNLVDTSTEILEILEEVSHTKIAKISFQFHFNSAWIAICAGIKHVALQDTPIEIFSKKNHPFTDRTRPIHRHDDHKNLDGTLHNDDHNHFQKTAFGGSDKITLTRVPSAPAALGDKNNNNPDVIHDKQEALQQKLHATTHQHIPHLFADSPSTEQLAAGPAVIPDHAGLISDAEKRMIQTIEDRPLGHILSDTRRKAMQIGAASDKYHHRTATEAYKTKTEFYRESLSGKKEEFSKNDLRLDVKKRRPISAPHHVRKHSDKNGKDQSVSGAGVRPGGHGLKTGGRRASGIEKPLTMAGDICFGDFCQLIDRLPDSERAKVKVNNNYVYRAKGCKNQISYKSLLVPRAEAKFLKINIDDGGADLKQLIDEHADKDSIMSYFVKSRLDQIFEKCKNDSYKIIFTSLRRDDHKLWDAINVTYRKMVYTEALVGMHPSRFYYSVPICESCYKVYAMMDRRRSKLMSRMPDKHVINKEERETMKHKMTLREKWKSQGRTAVDKVISVSQEYEHDKWLVSRENANDEDEDFSRLLISEKNNDNYYDNDENENEQNTGGRRSDFDFDPDEVHERYYDNIDNIDAHFTKKTFKVDVSHPEFKDRTARQLEREDIMINISGNDDDDGYNKKSYRKRFIQKMKDGKEDSQRSRTHTKAHGHKLVHKEFADEVSGRTRPTSASDAATSGTNNGDDTWKPPHVRKKDKTGFGPPAPTFGASYTRAVAKAQENRIKLKEKADKKKIEDKKRSKEEIFHITGNFAQIANSYKEFRTESEIKKREKQRHKFRPASAGVLVPARFMKSFQANLPTNDQAISIIPDSPASINAIAESPQKLLCNNNNNNSNNGSDNIFIKSKSSSDFAYTSLPFTPAPFLPFQITDNTTTTKVRPQTAGNLPQIKSNNLMIIDEENNNNLRESGDSGIYPNTSFIYNQFAKDVVKSAGLDF